VAVLQQITGINSVFFYAPMIFEQSGIGTNASFVQAIFVGLVNLVFTVLAILFIDKLGRKPLLSGGVAGIAISMIVLAFSFFNATYTLEEKSFAKAEGYTVPQEVIAQYGSSFENEGEMVAFLEPLMGEDWETHGGEVVKQSIVINSTVVLIAILAFVASFAISIGPVMWVLFSELFPNKIRAVAISFVGLINSAVSFLVQLVFPWELKYLGSGTTFLIYGLLAVAGLLFVARVVPETKGKSLEEIEDALVKGKA
jgi:MFS family permease